MLVISRRIGETFVIGDDIEVTVLDITGDKVILGVQAPREVSIARLDAASNLGSKVNSKGYGRRQKNRLTDSQNT